MHMGIINRILLFFYTIGIALLSLGVVVLCLQIVPPSYIWNEFLYLCSRWETAAVAVVVFIISIELCGHSFARPGKKLRHDKEALVVHGEMGTVRVAVEAIRNLVDKTARRVPGVREAKVKVDAVAAKEAELATVRIDLRLVIGQECNVAGMSDEIQKQVRRQMQEFIGIEDFDLQIVVSDIANAAQAKQRVV